MTESSDANLIAPATLQLTRILPAPPEKVWEYIVDPELRKLWFCAGATGAAAGEEFIMDFDHSRISDSPPPDEEGCGDPVVMTGRITVCDPPNEFAYEWPGEQGESTLVTIRLVPQEKMTRLVLTHERLESPEFRRGASAGWHAHLDLLSDLLHEHPARDFWVHYAAVKKRYES